MVKWAENAARMQITVNTVLVRNPRGKRQLGKLRHRWEYIIKTRLNAVVFYGVKWVHQS